MWSYILNSYVFKKIIGAIALVHSKIWLYKIRNMEENLQVTPFSVNGIKVTSLHCFDPHGTMIKIMDENYTLYFEQLLSYIFCLTEDIPTKNRIYRKKEIYVNYNYNGVDYAIIFTPEMIRMFIFGLQRIIIDNNTFHRKILSATLQETETENNTETEKLDITHILKKHMGPNCDFYKFFGVPSTTNYEIILFEILKYNRHLNQIIIIDTIGETHIHSLNQYKHINWNTNIF